MIKKIIKIFQPYMIRPTVYQCATKISIALVLALLWNRFINLEKVFSVVRDAFLVVGVFFFMLAWFQYLRLDGMKVDHTAKSDKKKKRHVTKDIVDYADEKIISFAELDDDERMFCRLLGDVVCGLLFLIPALVVWVVN
ncbi:MAG: hypothetical protein J6A94_02315 [Lachnospiraceae bacterium]|nr:hypothetical protein [Lachnospiraceae bacterium]